MRRHSVKTERGPDGLASRRLKHLSDTVNDLFQKATRNEAVLRRYQQFELQLLDVSNLAPLLDMLLCNVLDHFRLDAAELLLYDPQGTLQGLLGDYQRALPGLGLTTQLTDLQCLYHRQPEVRLVSGKGALPVFRGRDIQSAALLPLCRQGLLVGSLHLGAADPERFSADKSTDFIAHLASIVAVCLENVVSQERLHRLSMYDVLTQVKNRRAFHRALDEEVSRATRGGDPLSVVFVDLDYFKQINDNYGHPMGDKVLKVVAQHIDDQLRKTDHVCRYGGEEFALVLPNCGRGRALEVAERIRAQVGGLRIEDDTGENPVPDDQRVEVGVTLSVGACCWVPQEQPAPDLDEAAIVHRLIAAADRGVYQSKAAGRNCVHFVEWGRDPTSEASGDGAGPASSDRQ